MKLLFFFFKVRNLLSVHHWPVGSTQKQRGYAKGRGTAYLLNPEVM